MIKNFLKYSLTIFLSGLSVYLLTDKMLLPYILYVDEVAVPNIVGHDISTAAILLEDSNLKYKIQYVENKIDYFMYVYKCTYSSTKFRKIDIFMNSFLEKYNFWKSV